MIQRPRNTDKHTCRLGKPSLNAHIFRCDTCFGSLGITQHLIKSGIARLEEVRGADGSLENVYVRVDRQKVLTEGRTAAGKLLIDLQVRKSTADGAGARKFYTELTTPFEGWDGEIRDVVLKKKQVRISKLTYCFYQAESHFHGFM